MEEISTHAPYYWQPLNAPQVEIEFYTKEFQTINLTMQDDGYELVNLVRQQQLHRYGLFLMREQFLALYHPYESYFRVRRYVTVPLALVNLALETNLDRRRCNYEFVISSRIRKNRYSDDVVFIICVVTWDLRSEILLPSKNSDYFIEYVAYIR